MSDAAGLGASSLYYWFRSKQQILEYQRLWRRNVKPHIGTRQLRTMRPDVIREWRGAVVAVAGQDQAAKSYRLLRAVLATAEADDVIRQNPCRIRGGGEEHAEERPMVPTSLVLELADAIGDNFRAMVRLAGFAGLRTGETLGLRRCDVDLLHAEVRVVQQAQEITGQGRVVLAPKSEAGRRTITLPSIVVDGVTTKELMARIGHASPRAALIYQHATAERDHAIASYLDDVVAGTTVPTRGAVVGLGRTGTDSEVAG